jgi:hypothetical protein
VSASVSDRADGTLVQSRPAHQTRRLLRSPDCYGHLLGLARKVRAANHILNTGLCLAEERVTNKNRVRYLLACFLVGLIPVFGLCLLGWAMRLPLDEVWVPYLMAAAAGAVGAVFSIASRVQDLDIKPFAQSVMNYVMDALRVLTGFVAGAIILLVINGAVFGEGVVTKLLESPMTEPPARSWTCIVLMGFLGGFAERLVPSLLQLFKAEWRIGLPTTRPEHQRGLRRHRYPVTS